MGQRGKFKHLRLYFNDLFLLTLISSWSEISFVIVEIGGRIILGAAVFIFRSDRNRLWHSSEYNKLLQKFLVIVTDFKLVRLPLFNFFYLSGNFSWDDTRNTRDFEVFLIDGQYYVGYYSVITLRWFSTNIVKNYIYIYIYIYIILVEEFWQFAQNSEN